MLHQMFYLEMAWENFQHAYLTLTPHPTPQQSSKLLQIGNVPAIIKDAFCCIYACMYNVQVHFSGHISFINWPRGIILSFSLPPPPLVRYSTFQNNETSMEHPCLASKDAQYTSCKM